MAKLLTIYTIDESILADIDLLIDPVIPKSTRHLVKSMIHLCQTEKVNQEKMAFYGLLPLIEQLQKQEVSISKGRVSQIITALKKSEGVIEETIIDPAINRRRKKVTITSIVKIQTYFRNLDKTKIKKPLGRVKNVVFNEATSFVSSLGKGVHLTLDGETNNRIDQLFCMFDAAMKSSTRDKRKVIEVDYYFAKNDWIKITAVTTTEEKDDIAHLTDQRAMRVINGYYLDKIREEMDCKGALYQPDGYISFDINSLCRRMGMIPDNQTRGVARDMLHRLSSTEFRINGLKSPYFNKNFGAHSGVFRYLTESKSISEFETVDEEHALYQMKERFYRVRLHGDIVDSLMSMAFISHPKLSSEKSGLAQRLNNWSKAVIGVRPNTDKHLEYTLDQFHERVYPASLFSNFKRDFFKLLIRESSDEWKEEEGAEIVANIYGYYFKVKWCSSSYLTLVRKEKRRLKRNAKPIIVIPVRDTEDVYVGDNSDHNKALRQSAFIPQ